jgi:hypothetical protein
MDANQRGVMMVKTSTSWASYYEKNPKNNHELLLKRTAHFTEWHEQDHEWVRTLSDECIKCGQPQLESGSEIVSTRTKSKCASASADLASVGWIPRSSTH